MLDVNTGRNCIWGIEKSTAVTGEQFLHKSSYGYIFDSQMYIANKPQKTQNTLQQAFKHIIHMAS